MTAVAPAPFSISALISPVNAPETSALQSSPPMAMRPAAVCAARAISVAGRQIRLSADGGVVFTEAAIASMSPSCGAIPCIFQFPAIRGRITCALSGSGCDELDAVIGQELFVVGPVDRDGRIVCRAILDLLTV